MKEVYSYSVQCFDSLVARVSANNLTATRAAVILRPLLFEAFGVWGLFQGLFKNSTTVAREAFAMAFVVAVMVAFAVIYVSVKMLYDDE